MLILFQILFVLFACAALFALFLRTKNGDLSKQSAILWFIFWFAVIGVVLWPESASLLAHTFGIGRGADFIIYVSLAVLFFLVFRLHIQLEKTNRQVTRVVREKALASLRRGDETTV